MTYDFREARIMMTRQEALALLGFGPHDNPSEVDGKQARKDKLREAHPDLGGTTEAMQDINRAYDLLFPKNQPRSVSQAPAPRSRPTWADPPPRQEWTRPRETKFTWDQAEAGAGIPSGVEWQFTTAPHRDKRSYSGDESSFQRYAYGYYGRTADQHVFVIAVNVTKNDYFIGGGADMDIWFMKALKHPIKRDEQANPAWLHRQIGQAFAFPMGEFKYEGRFKSKVIDARGWAFSEKLPSGPEISIKQWLVDSGQVAGDAPSVAKRKQVVELQLSVASFGPKPQHYPDPKSTYSDAGYQLTLVLNGRSHVLNERDTLAVIALRVGGKRLLRAVFGEYYHHGGSKLLTRIQKGKPILEWMAQNLTGISDDARTVLQAAAAQRK